ncbi:hypothetical protein C1B90_21225 [Salmonella enterica]|uniref:Uncharacterized protein n=1 Tax=Salmonella enterica TaxID=28901 RepID=A0A5T4LP59_SALER|nr:hypothetical protein [Salmonella enterica]EBL7518562.1 hypothetical protein [Salmonella enterica]
MKAMKYIFLLSIILLQWESFANTTSITDNGKIATIQMPLTAKIGIEAIMRDNITVIPLSGLYEHIAWDAANRKFVDHDFLIRVQKSSAVQVLVEIINDQYTCSYNNPNWLLNLPQTIAKVNNGYNYTIKWSGGTQNMGISREAVIDDTSNWLTNYTTGEKYIDLTLKINFPDLTSHTILLDRGGICQGSVTILLSNKL